MTPEEQLQQRMREGVANGVLLVNQLLAPHVAAIDADCNGPESVAMVTVLNAYAQVLGENLSLESLKLAAQMQSIIVAELKKAAG